MSFVIVFLIVIFRFTEARTPYTFAFCTTTRRGVKGVEIKDRGSRRARPREIRSIRPSSGLNGEVGFFVSDSFRFVPLLAAGSRPIPLLPLPEMFPAATTIILSQAPSREYKAKVAALCPSFDSGNGYYNKTVCTVQTGGPTRQSGRLHTNTHTRCKRSHTFT